jgi:steroid delta-isomerase-like uncharacterized protein
MTDLRERAEAFWHQVFNRHDLTQIDQFIAPGSVNHNARTGTPDGPQGAREVFERLWAGSSDMQFEIQSMVAEGNKVVCIGIMHGTHDGPFQGIPATNNLTHARHIHVLTFNEHGLITEHLAVRDDVAFLKQLGVLPAETPPLWRTTSSTS